MWGQESVWLWLFSKLTLTPSTQYSVLSTQSVICWNEQINGEMLPSVQTYPQKFWFTGSSLEPRDLHLKARLHRWFYRYEHLENHCDKQFFKSHWMTNSSCESYVLNGTEPLNKSQFLGLCHCLFSSQHVGWLECWYLSHVSNKWHLSTEAGQGRGRIPCTAADGKSVGGRGWLLRRSSWARLEQELKQHSKHTNCFQNDTPSL